MEDLDVVFFSDDEDLTFFHLLAKGYSFMQLKTLTLNPFAFGLEVPLVFFVDLLQSHKVKAIVKRKVQNEFFSFNISGGGLDAGFSP